MTDFRAAAYQMVKAGFSVLPCGPDKRPTLTSWKDLQARQITPTEIEKHFSDAARIGVICGTVSGNMEVIDFDDPTTYEPFLDLVKKQAPDLPDKLLKRQTPSGGYHLIYRCIDQVNRNQVFARDLQGKVRIESRGEGGYILSAPSPGYEVINGSLLECQALIMKEVEILHSTARAFDQRQEQKTATGQAKSKSNRDRPGDLFNEEHTVDEMLMKYSWKIGKRTTAGMSYTRPGKDQGVSGVVLEGTGNFYCWSSNAPPIEAGKSYDAFALYTMYEHGGDFAAAARSLSRDQGTGNRHRKEYSALAADPGQPVPAVSDREEWEPTIKEWPVLDQRACRGIAGDFVALAAESSEADPAAILITFLVRFGVEVGNGPTLYVGDGKHHARFAAVIVGSSSKARKGTSWKPVDRLYCKIEH
jgi:hypothetical protein